MKYAEIHLLNSDSIRCGLYGQLPRVGLEKRLTQAQGGKMREGDTNLETKETIGSTCHWRVVVYNIRVYKHRAKQERHQKWLFFAIRLLSKDYMIISKSKSIFRSGRYYSLKWKILSVNFCVSTLYVFLQRRSAKH